MYGFIYVAILLLHFVSRWSTKENIVEQYMCAHDSSFNQLRSLVKYISSHLIKDYTRLIQHATRGFSRICERFHLSVSVSSPIFFFLSMFIYKKMCIKCNVAFLLIFIARYTYFRSESTSVTRWNVKNEIKYYQFRILINFKYFLSFFAHFASIISFKLNLNLRQTSSLICNPLFIIFSTQSGLTNQCFT